MIPLMRRLVRALLYDELAAVRWLRGLLFGLAGGGVAFADLLADAVGAPGAVKGIKVASAACGLLGGMITAGQRNPPPNDRGSDQLPPIPTSER